MKLPEQPGISHFQGGLRSISSLTAKAQSPHAGTPAVGLRPRTHMTLMGEKTSDASPFRWVWGFHLWLSFRGCTIRTLPPRATV